MTRARRLLTLAYKAAQRGETAIAGRVATIAFAEADAPALFEEVNASTEIGDEAATAVQKAEAVLRKAEATTNGPIFSEEAIARFLSIAKKIHDAGYPKLAKSLARATQ